jgi:Chitobiase/beta-hexosaminidase C-terminal domain
VAGFAALAVPAAAPAAINAPPKAPHDINVFPVRDFVSASGYKPGDDVTVEVLRNGLLIGRAAGVVPQDDPGTPAFDGLVEVNHPGGACWGDGVGSPNVTPDIMPGDVVRITTAPNVGDQTTTANVTAERVVDMGGGTVVVHGTAQDAAGNPLPVSQLEQRIIAGGDRFDLSGKRTLRADNTGGADGFLDYDADGSIHWTATYTGLTAADVRRAVSNQSTGMWLGTNPAAVVEGTTYETDEFAGPVAPCTAPLASNGVTTSTPGVVNAAFAATSADLRLAGVAQADVSAVAVTLKDPLNGAVTVNGSLSPAAAGQTWSATIPALALSTLAEGSLTASATFTVPGGTISGATLTILKDTVAPSAPTVTPGPGVYNADQSVKLTTEPGAKIAFTTGGTAVTATSPQYTGPIAVSAGQAIDALAIDAAGNVGPATGPLSYVIDKAAPTTRDDVGAGFSATDVTVTLTALDGAGTGVKETWYTTDGSDPSLADNPSRRLYDPASKPTLAAGQAIRYFSVDNAGNAEAVKSSAAVKVDKQAPSTTDDVPATFSRTDVTVTLAAGDGAGSGVAQTWFTTNGSNPADAANPARRPYSAAGKPVLRNGQSLRYYSVDKAGNAEPVKVTRAAKVDKTTPVTRATLTPLSGSGVTVTLTAADGGSGVGATWYTTDGSNPGLTGNRARRRYDPKRKPLVADGGSIRFVSVDVAGNVEAAKAAFAAPVVRVASSTMRSLRAGGLSVTTSVAKGATIVSLQVRRGSRAVGPTYHFAAKAGAMKVALKQRSLLDSLKPGTYQLVVRVGTGLRELGTPQTARFRISS